MDRYGMHLILIDVEFAENVNLLNVNPNPTIPAGHSGRRDVRL